MPIIRSLNSGLSVSSASYSSMWLRHVVEEGVHGATQPVRLEVAGQAARAE